MKALQNEPRSGSVQADPGFAGALEPGVMVLRTGGAISSVDARTLEILGVEDRAGLDGTWPGLHRRLGAAGFWNGGDGHAILDLSEASRVRFDLRADGGVLLVQDAAPLEALEADLRLSALMRSLIQVTPAVAHDLRAPINAMVFNVEILKETILSGKGNEPGGRERQLRYINVLKEELSRLHREMEIYIAHISPRGDRTEVLDLRELIDELVVLLTGPARKQQVALCSDMPEAPLFVEVNRYLFRQALLHLSLTALSDVPKEGTIELCVERRGNLAWVRIEGKPSLSEAAAGFDIHFSPSGTVAPIYAARALVSSQGGEVRLSTGSPQAYEIDLAVARNKE